MKILSKPFDIKNLGGITTIILFALIGLSGCSDTNLEVDGNVRAPKGLVATAGTRTVTLDWSGVAAANAYTVYWSHKEDVSKSNGAAIKISTNPPHFEHRGLANNTTYYYVVTSHTNTGESSDSNRVRATPQPAAPAQPEVAEIVAGDKRVSLYWENTVGALTYALYWSTEADVSVEKGQRIDDVRSPFVHSDRINATDYYYVLVAENPYGQGPASAISKATPQSATPTAPIITALELQTGQIQLSWEDVSEAQSYTLYWNNTGLVSTADTTVAPVTSPYTHAPLGNGTYYYRLQANNGALVSALSNEVQATLAIPLDPDAKLIGLPSVPAPAIPTNIIRELHDGRLTLRWKASDGAVGYNLYWKSSESGVTETDNKITNIQPPYTHIGLSNGETYYYRVSAINDGGESALSAEINGTPQIISPGVPAGVRALAGDQWIAVRWDEVKNASGYSVYYNGVVAPNVTSPHTITGLLNGTSYDITVTAFNGASENESAHSDPVVTVTPRQPPPHAPQNVTAQPQQGQVTVQWDAALVQDPQDGAEAVTEYRIYYHTRSGVSKSNGQLAGMVTPLSVDGRQQFTHTTLTNGQPYYYVVTALNASGGESRISQEAWARPQVPIPDAPSNVWTGAGDNQVAIYFTPAQNALSHNLYWTKALADGGRSDSQVITNVQSGSIFTDGPNANGNTYYFQVAAFNNGGESARTPEVDATPQVSAPQNPPQNIVAQAGNAEVNLRWDTVAEATLGYAIYWSTVPDIDPTTSVPILVPILIDSAQQRYTHSNIQNGLTYYYQIVAINEGGESSLSETIIAQPQVPTPNAPALAPVATAGNTTVQLDWPEDSAATSYTLYQHTNDTAPMYQWTRINGVVPGHTQRALTNSQIYYYRLSVNNLGGESGVSPIANATPLAPLPTAPANLAATAGDTQITLNWNTEAGQTYTLYWNTNPELAPINDTNKQGNVRPAYVHDGLINNTTYRYQITATNTTGESAATPILTATPQQQGNNPNNAPVFNAVPPSQTSYEGDQIVDLTVDAVDSDNDVLVYTATGLPPGLVIDSSTGVVSGLIENTAAANSPYSVQVVVNDQKGEPNSTQSTSFQWVVNVGAVDLVITSASTTATGQVAEGQYISVSYTVTNQGTVSTSVYAPWTKGFRVGLYLSKSSVPENLHKYTKLEWHGDLGPGQSVSNTVKYIVPLYARDGPGTYYLQVSADTLNNHLESDETNNEFVAATNPLEVIIDEGEDLVISRLSMDKTTITAGDMFTVSSTIDNIGTADTFSHYIQYYFVTDPSFLVADPNAIDDRINLSAGMVGYRLVNGLAKGATYADTSQLVLPFPVPPPDPLPDPYRPIFHGYAPGIYYLAAVVNDVAPFYHRQDEYRAYNNWFVSPTPIEITAPTTVSGPDLVITNVTLDKKPTLVNNTPVVVVEEGGRIGMKITVQNQGDMPTLSNIANWGMGNEVSVAISTTNSRSVHLGRYFYPELQPGESSTVDSWVGDWNGNTSSLAVGKASLFFYVDWGGLQTESNETNNSFETVVGFSREQNADLVISRLTVSPGPYVSGEPIVYEYTVTNQGTSSAYGFQVTLHVSVPSGGDGVYYRYIPYLPAGQSMTERFNLSVPFANPSVVITLNAIADSSNNQVVETDENNNASVDITYFVSNDFDVEVSNVALPNLAAGTSLIAGGNETVEFSVTNLGPTKSPDMQLVGYLSNDAGVTRFPVEFFGSWNLMPRLNVNQSKIIRLLFKTPYDVPDGSYTFYLEAKDASARSLEKVISNNMASLAGVATTVNQDLFMKAVSTLQSTWNIGDSIAITREVENISSIVDARDFTVDYCLATTVDDTALCLYNELIGTESFYSGLYKGANSTKDLSITFNPAIPITAGQYYLKASISSTIDVNMNNNVIVFGTPIQVTGN